MADKQAAPGYLDLAGAGVALEQDAFQFTWELVSALPSAPALPPGYAALGWSFCIDTDPATASRGFPMDRARLPCEFIIHARWDGSTLIGMLFDRRPLADGGVVVTSALQPEVDGAAVRVPVVAGLLGHPATFEWSAFTEELGELGTDTVHHVDAAPAKGAAAPVTWPGS